MDRTKNEYNGIHILVRAMDRTKNSEYNVLSIALTRMCEYSNVPF